MFNLKNVIQQIFNKKDEVVGIWENDLDDGSGLHAIWGWSFHFKEDGTGIHYSWDESKLTSEILFVWQRISSSTILAKYNDADELDKIEYTIIKVNGPYSSKLLKLTDKNYKPNDFCSEGFWGCCGAIFKVI